MKKNRGFTLLEIVITFAIIGILSYVAMISILQVEKTNLKNDALKIQQIIRNAQSESLLLSQRRTILISNEKIEVVNKENEIINTLVFNNLNKADINIGENGFFFTERGIVNTASTIMLESKNFKNKLTVNLGSGRVKVFEVVIK